MSQAEMFSDIPTEAAPIRPATDPKDARVNRAVRNQIQWMPRDLDSLLTDDHPARAIWALLEGLELSAFYASIKAVLDRPGHPATDPRVLLALWVYATVEGVGSARRLARLCDEHDAYRWLRGEAPINYHMLSDFRVAHQAALDDLLTQIVASLITFGVLLIFWVLGWSADAVGGSWGKVLSDLSILEHYDTFSKGVLDTKDVIYYVNFTVLALFLTLRSLEARRWKG